MNSPCHGVRGVVIWLTGLSGAGKSTLARGLARRIAPDGRGVRILDGDEMRATLCRDLGFSRADRRENVLRVGRTAAELVEQGTNVIAALISPARQDREDLRQRIGRNHFIEIYVNAPLEVCEHRDPKGLYARARAGVIAEFTGIDSPYEAPVAPDLEIRTDRDSPDQCVQLIHSWLAAHGFPFSTPPPEWPGDPVPREVAGSVASDV